MAGVLEINDVALRMHAPDREDIIEPGYALIDSNDGLLLGNAALAKSRINPPRTENDFWHWMDTQPIKAAVRSYQHNADLVFAQLEDLCRRSGDNRELSIVVPSNYTADQLSMLLGIAQHAGIDVQQVYDAALASTIKHADPAIERVIYTDIYLHHCVVTRLVHVGDELSVEEFRVVPGAGLLNLFDTWLHGVSDLFVRGTRFDPLHDAETEQKAFDQVYAHYLAADVGVDSTPNRLTIELENRHIELSPQQFSTMGKTIYSKIHGVADTLDSTKDAIRMVSDRVARLPGWQGVIEAIPIPAGAAVQGVPEHSPEADSEGVGYVTSLPISAAGPQVKVAEPVNNVPIATHLLRGAEALPLATATTWLESGTNGVRLRSSQTPEAIASIDNVGGKHQIEVIRDGEISVNGELVSSASLAPGDRVRISASGDELTLIRVRGNGAH